MIIRLLAALLFGLFIPVLATAQHDTSFYADTTGAESTSDTVLASIDSNVIINDIDSFAAITQQDTTHKVTLAMEKRNVNQKTWVFLLFVFTLILIGFTRSINLKKHYELMKEAFSIRQSSAGFENQVSEITLQNIMHLFVQCVVLANIVFLLFDYESIITFDSGFQAFLFTLVVVISMYVVKYFIYRIVTVILDIREMTMVVFTIQSSIGYTFTLIAFPVLVLIYYIKSAETVHMFMYLLAIIGMAYVLFRFIKVLLIMSQSVRLPRIYLFLYLCTLEIIPLIVMINWLGLGWI